MSNRIFFAPSSLPSSIGTFALIFMGRRRRSRGRRRVGLPGLIAIASPTA